MAQVAANLPNDFWQARESLSLIQQAAHSRLVSADATLGVVLARVAAAVPYRLRLPAIVGGRSTTNLISGLVGSPEAGKGAAASVAAELLPFDDLGVNIIGPLSMGSGEGVAELFFEERPQENGSKAKVKVQVHHNAALIADEGEIVARQGERKGTILLPTLRSVWSGASIGQTNATKDRHRHVEAGSYSLGVIINLQPEVCAPLLEDMLGTAQRITWFSAIDPNLNQYMKWPESVSRLTAGLRTHHFMHITDGAWEFGIPDAICRHLRNDRIGVVTGYQQSDPGQEHSNLMRLKLAALLALLDGRIELNEEDWNLATEIKRTSDGVRDSVARILSERVAATEREANAKSAQRLLAGDEAREERTQRLTEEAAEWIKQRVRRLGEASSRELQRSAHKKYRRVWIDAVQLAIDSYWIKERTVSVNGQTKRLLVPYDGE